MARNENTPRRLKGYYGFSKKYPSRRGERPIHESRRTKKRERIKKILFCVLLCCLFVGVFVLARFCYNLSTRPLEENRLDEAPLITADNIGTVRAIYFDNSIIGDANELSRALEDASRNGFNAILLDFKTREGILTYDSDLISYKADRDYNEINWSIIEKIKLEGFMVIGRIYCFEDSVAPQRLGAYVYENAEKTKIWFDAPAIKGGTVWLDPTNYKSTSYLNSVIGQVSKLGADCIYLESVQFPASRKDSTPVYTADDTTLNRNLVLMDFIADAVKASKGRPVILGLPLEGANEGDAEKWGGNLFDTPANICSPHLTAPSDGNYIQFIENSYVVLSDKAKNNFSTIKVIPTIQNQPENADFYENLSASRAESYIIVP